MLYLSHEICHLKALLDKDFDSIPPLFVCVTCSLTKISILVGGNEEKTTARTWFVEFLLLHS